MIKEDVARARARVLFTAIMALFVFRFGFAYSARAQPQLLVTFDQTGLDDTAIDVVVTINGLQKTINDLPFSMWVNNGSEVSYSYSSDFSSSIPGKRFSLINVTGPTSPFTVTSQVMVTGNYKTQYQMIFSLSSVGAHYDVVTDRAHSGTKSLYLELSDVTENRRNQLNIWGMFSEEVYVSVWLFLPADWALFSHNKWYELANPSWEVNGAMTTRLHVRRFDGPLHWRLFNSPDGYDPHDIDVVNRDVEVPRGRWFNLRYYVKKGISDGRCIVWIDDEVLFDVTGNTGSPATNFYTVVAKIYHQSNDYTRHQLWVDDLEIWDGLPQGPTPEFSSGLEDTTPAYPHHLSWDIPHLINTQPLGGPDFTGVVVKIDEIGFAVGDLPKSFWWDKNSNHEFTFASPLAVNASKKYAWISTSGLSTLQNDTLTIAGSGSITAHYRTEVKYQIKFYQTGVDSDFTGTVVDIDNVNYSVGALPAYFLWDAGSNHDFVFLSPLIVALDAKQYVWVSTTGSSASQSGSTTVLEPGNITGTYKKQYHLTMSTNFGTVAPGSGWHDAWTTIQTNASAPDVVDDEQYVWLGWTGTGSGSYSGTENPASITMDGPINETAAWRHEYYLTTTSSYGSPTPTSGWLEAGETITASVTSPVSGPSGTRYVCTGWTATGSVPTSGTTTSVTFTIDEPSSITWNWKTQFLLTVHTDPTGLSPQPTTEPAGEAGLDGFWYDDSTSVQLTAQPATGYAFLNWNTETTPVSQNSIIIYIDEPQEVTAHYARAQEGIELYWILVVLAMISIVVVAATLITTKTGRKKSIVRPMHAESISSLRAINKFSNNYFKYTKSCLKNA